MEIDVKCDRKKAIAKNCYSDEWKTTFKVPFESVFWCVHTRVYKK